MNIQTIDCTKKGVGLDLIAYPCCSLNMASEYRAQDLKFAVYHQKHAINNSAIHISSNTRFCQTIAEFIGIYIKKKKGYDITLTNTELSQK